METGRANRYFTSRIPEISRKSCVRAAFESQAGDSLSRRADAKRIEKTFINHFLVEKWPNVGQRTKRNQTRVKIK
jgi:hypothetical protein